MARLQFCRCTVLVDVLIYRYSTKYCIMTLVVYLIVEGCSVVGHDSSNCSASSGTSDPSSSCLSLLYSDSVCGYV